MLTVIFLGALLPHAATPAPQLAGSRQVALQEEMNILAYGVLQFGSSLHALYNSMAQKSGRIKRSIGFYEHGLEMLHRQTQRAKEEKKLIRGVVEGLKAEDTMLQQQAWNNKKILQKVLLGHRNLAQRVAGLEEILASMEERDFQNKKWELAALKGHMQQQNLTIWSLLREAQQQQQQMAQQMEQLLWIKDKTR